MYPAYSEALYFIACHNPQLDGEYEGRRLAVATKEDSMVLQKLVESEDFPALSANGEWHKAALNISLKHKNEAALARSSVTNEPSAQRRMAYDDGCEDDGCDDYDDAYDCGKASTCDDAYDDDWWNVDDGSDGSIYFSIWGDDCDGILPPPDIYGIPTKP